jgi:hypothetical protein
VLVRLPSSCTHSAMTGAAVPAQHRIFAGHRVGVGIGAGVDRVEVGDRCLDSESVEAGQHVVAAGAVAVGDQCRVPAVGDGAGGD